MPDSRQHSHQTGWFALLLTIFGASLGTYFVIRYMGLWVELDTVVFSLIVKELLNNASLINEHSYPNGYIYPTWLATLSLVSNISINDLIQIYLPVISVGLLAFVAFNLYRVLLGNVYIVAMASTFLLLVPEIVFSVVRGNHEKATLNLTLLVLFALSKSFLEVSSKNGQWSRFVAWVIVLYIFIFTLMSTHVFWGSTSVIAITITLVIMLNLSRKRSNHYLIYKVFTKRLTLVVATSWILTFLIAWYIYPIVGQRFGLISTTIEKLGTLFLSMSPESNPYDTIITNWRNPHIYRLISLFRYILMFGSFIMWILLTVKTLKNLEKQSLSFLLLLALYGAFGIQLAIAMPIDFIGLSVGSNLQVRLYNYFVILAAPTFALGLYHFTQNNNKAKKFIIKGALRILLPIVTVFCLLKLTLDPSISNNWFFYQPSEIAAIHFWDNGYKYRLLWTGANNRLDNAYNMEQLNKGENIIDGYTVDPQVAHALSSTIIKLNNKAYSFPTPTLWSENRPYDNGEAQIFHRIPETPFQY